MLALMEQPLRQGRSGSYSGEAKGAHGEAEVERLLVRGLAALELEECHMAETRKGAWGKDVLAWWLCQHITARRRWVSERLGMGAIAGHGESLVAQCWTGEELQRQPSLPDASLRRRASPWKTPTQGHPKPARTRDRLRDPRLRRHRETVR